MGATDEQDTCELPESIRLRFPSCDLKTLASLMGITLGAARARYDGGALDYLVMRTIRGDEWRPAGKITFDALRVRDVLDEVGRERFEAWQTSGRITPPLRSSHRMAERAAA
jgi:hypothetical protein